MSPELSEEFLRRLEGELACPGIIGLALTGSHARGEASESSDVDILRFVEVEPREPSDRYRLEIVCGRLVSISTTSVEAKRRELEGPTRSRSEQHERDRTQDEVLDDVSAPSMRAGSHARAPIHAA